MAKSKSAKMMATITSANGSTCFKLSVIADRTSTNCDDVPPTAMKFPGIAPSAAGSMLFCTLSNAWVEYGLSLNTTAICAAAGDVVGLYVVPRTDSTPLVVLNLVDKFATLVSLIGVEEVPST